MAKLTLNPISDPSKPGPINFNLQLIEDYINNYMLKRDGVDLGEANQLEVSLDLNSNQILNISEPTNDRGVANKKYVDRELAALQSELQQQIDNLNILTNYDEGTF